jgi:hypothetical protein
MAYADTACTGHFLKSTDPCNNKHATSNGIRVLMPNKSTIRATHTCALQLPKLPPTATNGHIFEQLAHPLISIPVLCDHDCTATFTKDSVTITRNDEVILAGPRDPHTGMWHLPLNPKQSAATTNKANSTPMANSAYHTTNKQEHVQFLHGAAGYPVPSTWIKGITANNYTTWPGLESKLVTKHLPKSEATVKGHLNQQRKNLRSTKVTESKESSDEPTPNQEPTEPTEHVYAAIIQEPSGRIDTDLTGRFPVAASSGNKYIFVLYHTDTNNILVEPISSRSEHELIRAYNKLIHRLTSKGFKPTLQRLDNEASATMKSLMTAMKVEFQLAPAGMHRRNKAERAIQTFKNHFVAILAGTDPEFPLHLWDKLIPQAETTLNLLRQSNMHPQLSAHTHLNGVFDFNKTPLAPLGTKAIVHEKPNQRGTWAIHGQAGWYVGHAPEHYRCYKVYVNSTRASRISDTVEFFPYKVPMPRTSSADAALFAARDLIAALQQPAPAGPFAIGDQQLMALSRLAEIFNNAMIKPSTGQAPQRVPLQTTDHKQPAASANTDPPVAPQRVPTTPSRPSDTNATDDSPAPQRVSARNKERQQAPRPPTHRYPTKTKLKQTLPHQAHFCATFTRQFVPKQTAACPLSQYFTDDECWQPHLANAVIDPVTGASLEYRQLIQRDDQRHVWTNSFSNELDRLAQGKTGRVKGTNTIVFIKREQVPQGRKVTYGRIVVDVRPQKEEKERTRLTVGGNLIDYPGDCSTKTAGLTTAKVLFNSTISTPDAKFMCMDVKNFYLNTPMDRYEYMRLPISIIPEEIINLYNLRDIVDDNGWVHIEIRKGMYGLPQAGILANKLLQQRLSKHGYHPVRHTHGLWRHTTRPIAFSLVVDDFGVKYVGREHAQHLHDTLNQYYTTSVDWDGKLYCGITLDWDYVRRTVDLSMPGYIEAALHKFQHKTPTRDYHAPARYTPPKYGKHTQQTTVDTTDPLNADQKLTLQRVVGTFLYVSRAIDSTMAHALNTLGSAQSKGTQQTAIALIDFLNYCATHPNPILRYVASDMQLHTHSDASYLTDTEARSRAGGHHYLGNHTNSKNPIHNGAILDISKILRMVVASAAEAEVGALFVNGQEATVLRLILQELGHAQGPTPMRTDNSTAFGIVNDTVKQKRSKAIDMRFYWLKDRAQQQQFNIYWAPGEFNFADYLTKTHPVKHYQSMRPIHLYEPDAPIDSEFLRGCVDPSYHNGTRKEIRRPTDRRKLLPQPRVSRSGDRLAANRHTEFRATHRY